MTGVSGDGVDVPTVEQILPWLDADVWRDMSDERVRDLVELFRQSRFEDLWHDAEFERDEALAEVRSLRARVAAAERKVRAVEMVHYWTNEDGRRFMFVDDVAEALEIPGSRAALGGGETGMTAVPWFAGLTVDHLFADCPIRRSGEATLREFGWWDISGESIDPHGTDVCGRCVARYDRSTS